MKKTLEIEQIPTHTTYKYLGNTGSAACPITLFDLTQQKEITQGSKIALLGIGSGASFTNDRSRMVIPNWLKDEYPFNIKRKNLLAVIP